MAHTMPDSEKRLRDYLYWFCIAVTVAQMAMGVLEFLGYPGLGMPLEMPMAYLFILSAYVARKEVDRWLYQSTSKRRGERFFWMWAFLVEGMLLVQWATHRREPLPHDVVECFLSATVVYLISGTSRILHCKLWRTCGRYLARRERR